MSDLIKRINEGPSIIELQDTIEQQQAEIEKLRHEYKQRGAAVVLAKELIAEKDAEIERLIGERDRQYDQNCEQIVRIVKLQAVVDAQAKRLRTVMINEPIASYELRCDVADQLAAALKEADDAT